TFCLQKTHKGHPELLHWIVDTDKDTEINNEKESMFDDWTVAKSQGQEYQFKEVESHYNDEDLQIENYEDFGDMSKGVYNHKEGFKVVRVFQGKKLIQEYKFIPKDDTEKEQV
ncbi:hypothetical protein ABEV80_12910, partial [Heyndrickxia ginsengihumi]